MNNTRYVMIALGTQLGWVIGLTILGSGYWNFPVVISLGIVIGFVITAYVIIEAMMFSSKE